MLYPEKLKTTNVGTFSTKEHKRCTNHWHHYNYEIRKWGATISSAPPKKNLCISKSLKAQMSGLSAQRSTNDAQKKALGFVSKFKSGGAREMFLK
jgi:hypothetical protein